MLRLPLDLLRSPQFEDQVQLWQAQARPARGEEARQARQRLKELKRLEGLLPYKPFLGRNVPKSLIPKTFVDLGVSNLFRNDMPGGWRMLHTVVEVDERQAVVELVALSHPDYEDLFGSRGR